MAIGFTVPAGETVTITGSSAITGDDCGYSSARYYLYDHSSTQLKNISLGCGSAGSLFTATLAAASYTVLIVPTGLVYGTLGRRVAKA